MPPHEFFRESKCGPRIALINDPFRLLTLHTGQEFRTCKSFIGRLDNRRLSSCEGTER